MKKKLKRILKNTVPLVIYLIFCFAVNAYAEDMWEVANRIIVDVYNKIAGIGGAYDDDMCCRHEAV